MAAFADQLASLQAAVTAPPQARHHRRSSFAKIADDVASLKQARGAGPDDAARIAREVKAYLKEIREEAPTRDADYDPENAAEMRQELKALHERLESLAAHPEVSGLRAEVASLREGLASPEDRKRKATYANLQRDVDELRARRQASMIAGKTAPKPAVDEQKLLDAMASQFRVYANDLKAELSSAHDANDDVKRELVRGGINPVSRRRPFSFVGVAPPEHERAQGLAAVPRARGRGRGGERAIQSSWGRRGRIHLSGR